MLSQSAPPARPTAEVITLSPFTVDESSDVGYLATNSLAGSRLNTKLKDTASAISVLTPEFLSDIAAFDLTSALNYSVNVEQQLDDSRVAINGNETVNTYQTYRVRGLPATVARNYFLWTLPSEVYNLERIEDSRGPNSVLFGIASPGGLINAATKQPQDGRTFRKAAFTVGSYGSYRGAADCNQPVPGGKFAVRFNAVYNDANSFRFWAGEESQRAHLAVKYAPSRRAKFRAEYEGGQITSNAPRTYALIDAFLQWNAAGRPTFASPLIDANLGINRQATAANQPRVTFIGNNRQTISMRGTMLSTGVATGNALITDTRIADRSINIGGPAQDRFSHFNTLSAYFEYQLGKRTFLEVAYNHQYHNFDRYDPRSANPNGLVGDPNQLMNDGKPNPYAGQLFLETSWIRTVRRDDTNTGRAMVSTEFDARKWGNYRLAAYTDYEKSFAGGQTYNETWIDGATGAPPFNPLPENTQNFVYRRSYLRERDWASYHVNGAGREGLLKNVTDPVTGRTLASAWIIRGSGNASETFSRRTAYMAAGEARYFGGRLIFIGGIRRDEIRTHDLGTMRNPVTQIYQVARSDAEATGDQPSRAFDVGRNMTAGVVFHLHPLISLFSNRADNIDLPARGNTTLPASGEPGHPIPVPSPRGEGQDYGLALNLLDGRLYARAAYYTTAAKGQSTTFSQPTRDTNTRILSALQAAGRITQAEFDRRSRVGNYGLFDFKSEGVELQITGNVTPNWRVQAGYAYTDAIEENTDLEWKAWDRQNVQWLSSINTVGVVTSAARTIAEEIAFYQDAIREQSATDGSTKLGNRRHKVSVFTRYNLPFERLRGAYVGGGYRHQSKVFTGVDAADQPIWGNSFSYVDVMAGYRRHAFGHGRTLNIQLNVDNVFDRDKPLVTRYGANGLVVREVLVPGTSWRLTTNLEF